MIIRGKVINTSLEERDLVGKDGVKRQAKISHVLMMCESKGAVEVVNLRSYDATWELPKIGSDWETPRVRKYENYDGNVAEVSV